MSLYQRLVALEDEAGVAVLFLEVLYEGFYNDCAASSRNQEEIIHFGRDQDASPYALPPFDKLFSRWPSFERAISSPVVKFFLKNNLVRLLVFLV